MLIIVVGVWDLKILFQSTFFKNVSRGIYWLAVCPSRFAWQGFSGGDSFLSVVKTLRSGSEGFGPLCVICTFLGNVLEVETHTSKDKVQSMEFYPKYCHFSKELRFQIQGILETQMTCSSNSLTSYVTQTSTLSCCDVKLHLNSCYLGFFSSLQTLEIYRQQTSHLESSK